MHLPREILEIIFSFANCLTLARLAQVCHRFRSLADVSPVWRDTYFSLAKFPTSKRKYPWAALNFKFGGRRYKTALSSSLGIKSLLLYVVYVPTNIYDNEEFSGKVFASRRRALFQAHMMHLQYYPNPGLAPGENPRHHWRTGSSNSVYRSVIDRYHTVIPLRVKHFSHVPLSGRKKQLKVIYVRVEYLRKMYNQPLPTRSDFTLYNPLIKLRSLESAAEPEYFLPDAHDEALPPNLNDPKMWIALYLRY